jgi:hypothetical protein
MPSSTLSSPFFTGTSISTEVPGRFDISLNGRPFMLDLTTEQTFTRRSIPLLRNQADTGSAPGEQSLSPEELWRRSTLSWDHGAGQAYLDREDSDPRRFRSSKGVNVWNRWAISLLNETANKRSSAGVLQYALTVGTRLYVLDGASLVFTTSLAGTPTFTAVTGLPNPPLAVATDGFAVFTAHGASGVYVTTRTTGASSSMTTGNVTNVAYVKGRLMASQANSLYNITTFTSAALPAALFSHPNIDFVWTGFTEGTGSIYAAGFSGDKSLIYRIGLNASGTSLDQPIAAGELPDGEIIRSIGSYLGYILLGTDRGVRFCTTAGDGSLTIGSLTPTPAPVLCFEGQDRYVWFGWSNYDATSSGLGRMDLSTFIFPLTPAYASDLMATGQGAVSSVVTFGGVRVFTVNGLGLFAEQSTKVASGTLDTGLIGYGVPDNKVAVFLDVRLSNASGANSAYIAVDGAAFAQIGTRTGPQTDMPFLCGQVVGENFEVRHELIRDATVLTAGPVISRALLRAYPKPKRGEIWEVPILLHEVVKDRSGADFRLDPIAELDMLRTLQETRALTVLQVGSASYTVLLDDSVFAYSHATADRKGWNGTFIARLKSFGS